ncbi:hypothetical protein PMAYCL1PPCAC_26673, partial [Pristionchus mayeri]
VSDGLDSISVFQSIISGAPSNNFFLFFFFFYLPLICVATPIPNISPVHSAVLAKLGLTSPPNFVTPLLPVPDHFWKTFRKVEQGMLDEDSIRLFYPKEIIDLNSGLLLSFNLSLEAQRAQNERVIGAHMKLHVRCGEKGSLRVYRIEDLSRLRVERLLDSVEIIRQGENQDQLIDLDVTESIPYSNQLHLVRFLVVFHDDCVLADTPSHSISSISQSQYASASLIVSYLEPEGEDLQEIGQSKRRKRFSEEEKRRKERKERRTNNRKHRTGGEKGLCHRKSMYVDFDELRWNDWILAPRGYEAYQCSGGCPFPFPAQVNASNHAIIQGLLHNYNDEIPEPCCVPTEMAPLTILFREVSNRITIKIYPDMIVSACGCR